MNHLEQKSSVEYYCRFISMAQSSQHDLRRSTFVVRLSPVPVAVLCVGPGPPLLPPGVTTLVSRVQ